MTYNVFSGTLNPTHFTSLFFVHLRSRQKRTEKVVSNYLFEVFRALVRSVEWSGVSGVDSPGSVPGPPQRLCSQQCASCTEVHYWVDYYNGPRCSQSLLKVLNTTLALHFLFGNSLINRFTPYLFDCQIIFINVLSSFVNILSF